MRNTDKFYYPLTESILSVLSIVDEFVIALGKGDPDDRTEEILRAIRSDKIKIIPTEWNVKEYPGGTEFAHQTDIAKQHCTGDWLIYLQSDEVIHEDYLPVIQEYCKFYLRNEKVEGFLFDYKHFFGDYDHYIVSHCWYPREIRIIRNQINIHSWGDAQSFKVMESFNGKDYRQKKDTRLLNVVKIPAEIFHYGWVRPPYLMQVKSKAMDSSYHDPNKIESEYSKKSSEFDYGSLHSLDVYKRTHPEVMAGFISKFNWKDKLHYEKKYKANRVPMKHEKLKYRIISWIEQNLMGGKLLFGYKNWRILPDRLK